MSSLQEGLAVVQVATDADKAEDYRLAIEKYHEALLLFAKAVQGNLIDRFFPIWSTSKSRGKQSKKCWIDQK